jgi:hypothetical protein
MYFLISLSTAERIGKFFMITKPDRALSTLGTELTNMATVPTSP